MKETRPSTSGKNFIHKQICDDHISGEIQLETERVFLLLLEELLEIPKVDKDLLFRKSLERIVYMWGSRSNDFQEFTAIVVMMECSIDSALAGMSNAIREKLTFGAGRDSYLLLDVVTEAEEMVNRYLTLLRSISQTIGWQTLLVQLFFESLPKTLNHTVTAWGIPHIDRNVIHWYYCKKLVFRDYWEDNILQCTCFPGCSTQGY
ncbi:unnamed protein product [Caenorhabditis nigoni]